MNSNRGSALLAVLWLSAALSAIAFSIAVTVRSETERTATYTEGVRAYYLAAGALDRALLYIQWGPGPLNAEGKPRYFKRGMSMLRFQFPSGEAWVEVVPESAKVDVNRASPEMLYRLLMGVGVAPEQARALTLAIVDWRSPAPDGPTGYDPYYLSLTPSFPSRHASFQEIEELLLVRGMTTEIFYGGYTHDADERLVPRGGLRDCISVYGATGRFDVNASRPAVLLAAGLAPETVEAIVKRRQQSPFLDGQQMSELGEVASRVQISDDSILSLRATARVRLSDGRLSDTVRSVEAVVKIFDPDAKDYEVPYHILRWYDNVWAQ